MTSELALHPHVARDLERLTNQPPQTLLLTGPTGVGKGSVATELLEALGMQSAYVLRVEPEAAGKAIGIEAVRTLEHFLSLAVPKQVTKTGIDRAILIENAEALTTEAQNALLKTLEEPPVGTIMILTATSQDALLPTVRSRVQVVAITQPPTDLLRPLLPADQAERILALSGGLPGLAMALAQDDQSHPLVQAATTARQLLGQSTFEKLTAVDGLAKNKVQTLELLNILQLMAHAALLTGRGPERWQRVLTAAHDAQTALQNGVQTKLALIQLMLSL